MATPSEKNLNDTAINNFTNTTACSICQSKHTLNVLVQHLSHIFLTYEFAVSLADLSCLLQALVGSNCKHYEGLSDKTQLGVTTD